LREYPVLDKALPNVTLFAWVSALFKEQTCQIGMLPNLMIHFDSIQVNLRKIYANLFLSEKDNQDTQRIK